MQDSVGNTRRRKGCTDACYKRVTTSPPWRKTAECSVAEFCIEFSRSFRRISYHKIQYWILELSKCNHKSNNMIFFYNKSDHCPIENSWEHPQCEDVKRVVDDSATTRNLSLDLIQQIWDLFSKQERCIQSLSCSLLLEQSFTTTSTNISVSMKGRREK